MKQKTNQKATGGLITWTLRAPLKFAVICAALFTILALVAAPEFIGLMTPFVFLVAGYFTIRGAQTGLLDRRSYVAVDNALSILALIASEVSILITPFIPYIMIRAFDIARAMHIVAMFTLFVISYYLIGLVLMNLYAVYLRVVKMGVPRWKAILTMPFTSLYCPAYFLGDGKEPKNSVIPVRSTWFARLTDWVVARPRNAVITYAILTALSLVTNADVYSVVVTLTPIALFVLFMLVTNPSWRRENIAGAFANISILINIVLIVYSLGQYIG